MKPAELYAEVSAGNKQLLEGLTKTVRFTAFSMHQPHRRPSEMDHVTPELHQISSLRVKPVRPAGIRVVISCHESWHFLGGVCCNYLDMQALLPDSAARYILDKCQIRS